MPQKTTVLLMVLLIAVVTLVGSILLLGARDMLQTSHRAQVSSFAYGVAATLGDSRANARTIQLEFDALDKTPNLNFVVLTDPAGRHMASYISDGASWAGYRRTIRQTDARMSPRLGRVEELLTGDRSARAVTVPVFRITDDSRPDGLFGYLHASFDTQAMDAQLRVLQAMVLFTCMAVVLLAVPIAGLIARHITVPIQRLAAGAHALADGDLSHRVTIRRRDELGELANAFNRMADTVQTQQADIRAINAGLEQKVVQRTTELEKVNRRLESEIAEKEDFLRAVSHDLNAPLRNIAGMASMLALKYAGSLEQDALQRLERIQKNVQIECELINELLELSRLRTRREKIEPIDLHEMVTTLAEGFSSDLETRGITLRVLSRLPVMRGERLRLRQVFQNLIDNAIKYMRPDGPREIRISATADDGQMVFSVADTGMGVATEDLPHLFHVFRRAKNASVMKVPGKGVGLASAKSILENYNARLWAQSVPGQGTTFYFAIPLTHFELAKEVAA